MHQRRYHIPPARIGRYAMENKQMESPPPNPIGACRDGYTANFLYIHKFTCFASGSMYNPNSIALYVYIYPRVKVATNQPL